MFTAPAPAAPTLSTSTSQASPTTPSRPSRLRGLSYLRNYTHSLHSSAGSSSSAAGGASRADSRSARAPASPTAKPSSTSSSTAATRPRSASTVSDQVEQPIASPPPSTTIAGQSGPSSNSLVSQVLAYTIFSSDNPSSPDNIMTRVRPEPAAPQLTVRNNSGPTPTSTTSTSANNMDAVPAEGPSEGAASYRHLPSIRLIPHQDPRANRPSLQFPTITRTLPDESCVIRVGRYSERDNFPEVPSNVPSAAAVGFKSKVVSRKHCELWCSNSQWYIKDVKSSSGTFLNHIRLSQPNVESKPFKVKDGDIIQLGIDFRGGEEMIFRCVKIRIECNRGWQQGLNTFNKQTHQRLKNLAKAKKDSDSASTYSSECSICLMSIAPCQSLFVAPCSHVWHYKCIRPILNGPQWPNFLCPNCRAVADLEADVDDPTEYEQWDSEPEDSSIKAGEAVNGASQEDRQVTPRASTAPLIDSSAQSNNSLGMHLSDLEAALSSISLNSVAAPNGPQIQAPSTPPRIISPAASSSVTQPVPINIQSANEGISANSFFTTSSDRLSPERTADGPMTPRNDAGPFVLDGSGSARGSASRRSTEESGASNSGSTAPVLPPLHMG